MVITKYVSGKRFVFGMSHFQNVCVSFLYSIFRVLRISHTCHAMLPEFP